MYSIWEHIYTKISKLYSVWVLKKKKKKSQQFMWLQSICDINDAMYIRIYNFHFFENIYGEKVKEGVSIIINVLSVFLWQ